LVFDLDVFGAQMVGVKLLPHDMLYFVIHQLLTDIKNSCFQVKIKENLSAV
jgi:hypothetical protein